jgi:farnesyl diphosphate synthase
MKGELSKLEKKLLATTKMVNKRMLQLLPPIDQKSKLLEAVHYSAICDGKRIRPFLTILVAQTLSKKTNINKIVLDVACAIEFIHIYSLIHDDLPAMDNDDFRRGKPTCHKKFDEATAILAGDTLLTYSFEILSNKKLAIDPNIKCQLTNIIAKAIGYKGMAGGQMIDLEAKNYNLSPEQVFELHNLKTGKMIVAAIQIGALLGEANDQALKCLVNYGADIGLAFQIKDDIIDFYEEQMKLENKPDHINIVNLIGLEESNSKLQFLINRAVSNLQIFGTKGDLLKELASFIANRKI